MRHPKLSPDRKVTHAGRAKRRFFPLGLWIAEAGRDSSHGLKGTRAGLGSQPRPPLLKSSRRRRFWSLYVWGIALRNYSSGLSDVFHHMQMLMVVDGSRFIYRHLFPGTPKSTKTLNGPRCSSKSISFRIATREKLIKAKHQTCPKHTQLHLWQSRSSPAPTV